MIFRQFLNEAVSAASYLIGCVQTGESAVVDPGLPPEEYLMAAADKGLRITAIVETHFHADYFSTGRALAALTGATIYAPSRDDIENEITGASVHYPHTRVRDGDEIRIGNIILRAIHTPGHTPEHMAYAVIDTPRSDQPWMVLTGDSLFVNDVARTDLVNLPLTGPEVMFNSLQRLLELPDYCEIYPAHYGGSACGGKQMSGKPISTIGFERRFNWMLQARNAQEFAELSGVVPREAVESVLIHRNTNRGVLPLPAEATRPVIHHRRHLRADMPALSVQQAYDAMQSGAILIDLRPALAFAAGHPAGAINITFNKSNMVERARMLLGADTPLMFISDVPLLAQETAHLFSAEGFTVAGYVQEPVDAWLISGLPVERIAIGDLEALHRYALTREAVILDVREPFEWEKGVIPGDTADVRLIALSEIRQRWRELPADRTIVIVCESGTRASAVASLLKRLGYANVVDIAPQGMSDYAKKYETVRPELAITT
ncbi:MAG: rhodanese-like domain-containing protein [Roseiflexus sp.]|nr:rhodanese-like domain-containing protein [Roseiflexus sp.]MCS7287773.1 rhodanese-like domain-containing protein [Roseiflexus sp.]MDW8147589.1 rhodanese-like domain-containing protein [Roseiflexaceae bacterium]